MYFALKSALWLSLVFSCMNWPGGERPDALVRQTAGDVVSRTQALALEKATAACAGAPGDCLAAAARATTLAQRLAPSKATDRAKSIN